MKKDFWKAHYKAREAHEYFLRHDTKYGDEPIRRVSLYEEDGIKALAEAAAALGFTLVPLATTEAKGFDGRAKEDWIDVYLREQEG